MTGDKLSADEDGYGSDDSTETLQPYRGGDEGGPGQDGSPVRLAHYSVGVDPDDPFRSCEPILHKEKHDMMVLMTACSRHTTADLSLKREEIIDFIQAQVVGL